MPRSFDPAELRYRQLPADKNPLERLESNPKIKPFDFDEIIEQFKKSWERFVVPAVLELTGLNLSSGQALVASIIHIIQDALSKIGQFLHVAEWQAWLDKFWQSLTGVKPDTTITADDTADQFALLMASTAAQATTIAQLLAAVNKPAGGVVGGDDFERPDAPDLGSGWLVVDNGAGSMVVAGGQAVFKRGGIAANTIRCWRVDPKDAQTATPFQAVTRVTGTTVLQTVPLGNSAQDMVFARVSDDHKAYMVAWWDIGPNGKGRLHLGYNLGTGNDREVDGSPVPCPKPAPGVPLTLECGDANPDPTKAPYSYRVIRENSVLIEWDDPTRLTTPLITNRGWGFGGHAQFGAFGQITPSSAHSVTVADTRSP
jgi:hypothetical protein